MLAILAIAIVPQVSAWCIPPNPAGEDNKFELYGPHVTGIVCKVYADTTAEWTDMQLGHVDIEDWALDPAWIATFGAPQGPWTEQNYGGEAGYYLLDVNNNATINTKPDGTGSLVPNPTSDFFLREALAYAANRSDIVALDSTATPIYTPVPAYMAGYINSDIAPGMPGAAYTYGGYTGNTAAGIAILDANYFPIGGDGWRYWDMNHNGVKDAGEDLSLIFWSRGGLRGDYGDHYNTILNNVYHIHTAYTSHVARGTVDGPVFHQEYFNLYTGGWIYIGPDPDYLCDLYNGSNYYNPGAPQNYLGINYADSNAQLTGIKLATSLALGQAYALQAQYFLAKHAAMIPLWSVTGVKDYQNVPSQGSAYGNWTHLVNQRGQGVNSWWSTLNMYTTGALYPPLYVYYGFSSTVTLQNIVYSQWYWDSEVVGRIYDGGAARQPLTLASWYPQLFKSWQVGTWFDALAGQTKTAVTVTLRPDVYWQDGHPLTAADVIYTLVECSKDLIDPTRPGGALPPPWWYPTVQYMKSIEMLDAYNVEILLDVNSIWALGWVIGSVIIPKHIWQPIIGVPNGAGGWKITPSGAANAVQGQRPDPFIIGTGPFRWVSGVGDTVGSTVTLVSNTPGSVVNGITSPGYYLYYPIYVDIGTPSNNIGTAYYNAVKYNDRTTDYMDQFMFEINLYNLFLGYTGDHDGTLDVSVWVWWQNGTNPAVRTLLEHDTSVEVPSYNYTADFTEPIGDTGGDEPLNVWTLDPGENMLEKYFMINLTNPSFNQISVAVQITSPPTIDGDGEVNPWLGKWVNVTLPIYLSPRTDIAGSNLYDDLKNYCGLTAYGLDAAVVKNEVPTPDQRVDGRDIVAAARAFGSFPGYPLWNSVADVNGDFKVDGRDIVLIARDFGYSAASTRTTVSPPLTNLP